MFKKLLTTVFLTMVFGVLTAKRLTISEYCDSIDWNADTAICKNFLITLRERHKREETKPLEEFCSKRPNFSDTYPDISPCHLLQE